MENNMKKSVLEAFELSGAVISCERYGEGHINETYKVVCEDGAWYILQKLSRTAFKRPDQLMENIANVTKFLQERVNENREALHLIPTKDGEMYHVDADGEYYRVYDFIMDSYALQMAKTPDDFYESAVAFGNFQKMLVEFPAKDLYETIENFHNTPSRFANFKKAIANDVKGRVKTCEKEIEGFLKREKDASLLTDWLNEGKLPLKVTHNDTKLNNVLMDSATKKAVCVIDLDTVMPGLVAYDFGDSIRFGASTALEDETDLSKVNMSLELFKRYTEGFLEACGEALTENEIKSLCIGAKLMTLECGSRFLTDYLEGDVYFRTHRENHNLDRARTQLKLVEDMEQKWEDMEKIVAEIANNIGGK